MSECFMLYQGKFIRIRFTVVEIDTQFCAQLPKNCTKSGITLLGSKHTQNLVPC